MPDESQQLPKASPEEIYFGLRERALTVAAEQLDLDVEEGEAYGLVVDMGYQNAVVTVVAMGEGTASLYFSSGGGIIGSGQHARVRDKVLELVHFAGRFTHLMLDATSFQLPQVGRVRLYVLTGAGPVVAESSEVHLTNPESPLHPLYMALQDLITEIRLVSEERDRQAR
jgi:hypothetical protein